jgi:hypothetical protein
LLHFNDALTNDVDYYNSYNSYLQSGSSVNSTFGRSINLSLPDRPLIINDSSVLNKNDGTVEFWVAPLRDVRNDDVERYYIDAYGAFTETVTSLTSNSLQVSKSANSIISVRLVTDTENSGTNYFTGGRLQDDGVTILLGAALPSYNMSVKVTYIPRSLTGNRLRIYKGENGYLNFAITAAEGEYNMSADITSWNKNTWHRIFASWDLNNKNRLDMMRLIIDGVVAGTIKYGPRIYGSGIRYGQLTGKPLEGRISFADTVHSVYVGSDYLEKNPALVRIDNLRFSSVARSVIVVGGLATDPNYSAPPTAAEVVEDVYTTYINDFDGDGSKFALFSRLINAVSGIYDYDVDVIDSFDKVIGVNNGEIETLMETLLNGIKPAHSTLVVKFTE